MNEKIEEARQILDQERQDRARHALQEINKVLDKHQVKLLAVPFLVDGRISARIEVRPIDD